MNLMNFSTNTFFLVLTPHIVLGPMQQQKRFSNQIKDKKVCIVSGDLLVTKKKAGKSMHLNYQNEIEGSITKYFE